ncbi:MAG: hypothetical protein KGJ82_03670 [Nitrospirota bacterium]|nr:hypothetical protein [Nitrospirota bacterium]
MTEELFKAILPIMGVVVGFFLSSGLGWLQPHRKIKTHWHAIRAEMTLCKEKTETLLETKPPVLSPLYRFPVVAVQTAYPILLTEGVLNEQESLAVSRYSSQVGDINRGLDFAASRTMADDMDGLKKEYGRLILKTEALLSEQDGHPSVFEAAKTIVDGKLLLWREFL